MNLLGSKPERAGAISANLAEYGDLSDQIQWVTPDRALTAEAERGRFLADLTSSAEFECRLTKPHIGPLSPGCRICGLGAWSCLFINGKCNCRCFYCPSPQAEISVPTTHRIPFSKPRDYASYIETLDFRGASISGGEPLVTPDRTLRFIDAVRRLGDDRYIWMYTNGTLLTTEHVAALAAAGLNEIRFDLSAVDYDLKKIALAAGRIPCVTVEIPAIPEDRERLGRLLPDLKTAGVDHLNLHQLRLTPHNSASLLSRGYTFLHGEKVTVLESELTALSLMRDASEKEIGLPINYCSFVYKHRYQNMAVRRRLALLIKKDHEGVTENGYIRTLSLNGPATLLEKQVMRLSQSGADNRLWQLSGKKDKLFFGESLWPQLDPVSLELQVVYSQAVLCAHTSYRYPFKEIQLASGKKLIVEKKAACKPVTVPAEKLAAFSRCLSVSEDRTPEACGGLPEEIEAFEWIRPGLQDYY